MARLLRLMFVLLLPLLVVMARAGKRSLPDYLPFLVLVLLVPAILLIRHLLQTVSRRRISQKMTFLSFMLCYGVAAVAALFLMPLARTRAVVGRGSRRLRLCLVGARGRHPHLRRACPALNLITGHPETGHRRMAVGRLRA